MSDFISFISKVSGEGGSKLEIRSDTFKTSSRHEMVDTNWAPTEKYIGFLLKYSDQFVQGFSVIDIHILMNRRNSPKSRLGPLIILLVSTIMNSPTKNLVERGRVLWGKSRHWFILCSSHQVLLYLVDSILPSYVICHSIYIPLYIMIIHYIL